MYIFVCRDCLRATGELFEEKTIGHGVVECASCGRKTQVCAYIYEYRWNDVSGLTYESAMFQERAQCPECGEYLVEPDDTHIPSRGPEIEITDSLQRLRSITAKVLMEEAHKTDVFHQLSKGLEP